MKQISIIEPLRIKTEAYKVSFRKGIPLEKYENAILGIILENGGSFKYDELGLLLGFAMIYDKNSGLRKDFADIHLYDSHLRNLKNNHLIEFDKEKEYVKISEWGEMAFHNKMKYLFYSGTVFIPEFFDIKIEEYLFPFKEIGIKTQIENSKKNREIWSPELSSSKNRIIEQIFLNSSYDENLIYIDFLNSISTFNQYEVNLKFQKNNNKIEAYNNGIYNESLTKIINQDINIDKADYLRLRLDYVELLEVNSSILFKDLRRFISIIDWEILLENEKLVWDTNSIIFLEQYAVNWILISKKIPIEILVNSLDSYKEYFDWNILTKRISISFILSSLDKYSWDTEGLLERITIDDFKEHISQIVQINDIDCTKYYKELDLNFIKDNFNILPKIENYIIEDQQDKICSFINMFPNAIWNIYRISQKIDLDDFIRNINEFENYVRFDVILQRIITEKYNCTDETFCEILDKIDRTDEFLVNKLTNYNFSLIKLLKLEEKNLIYWGNKQVPGFEVNKLQNWSKDIINTFDGKWNYKESICHLSLCISDEKLLENTNIDWDYKLLSKNSKLLNKSSFFNEYISKLDLDEAIPLLNKNSLISYLDLLIKEYIASDNICLSEAISNCFTVADIIDNYNKYKIFFKQIAKKLAWEDIIERTDTNYIKSNIENLFSIAQDFDIIEELQTILTSCFSTSEILSFPDYPWDWNVVTQNAIEQKLIGEESIIEYLEYWNWEILVENYFTQDDLLLENKLSQIATLISQTAKRMQDIAWAKITEIYPSHLLWKAINTTQNIDIFLWDWDYISSSNNIAFDLETLNKYKDKINWERLSSNPILNSFFKNDRTLYTSRKQWESYIYSYLSKFRKYWDFKELSKLDSITRNGDIIDHFRSYWDWKILSSNKSKLLTRKYKDTTLFDMKTIDRFKDFIDFGIVSQRDDTTIELDLIEKFNSKNWDWKSMSKNERLNISKEVLLNKLLDKPWDWLTLSRKSNIEFNNEDLIFLQEKNLDWEYFSSKDWIENSTLVQLSNKAWNWEKISQNKKLIFDEKLLSLLSKQKDINWIFILNSDNLCCSEICIEIIAQSIKENKNLWSILSRNKNIVLNDNNLLEKYKDFWDWDTLIEYDKIDFNSIRILKDYSNYLNWSKLSSLDNFIPSQDILQEFHSLLNWKHISQKLPLDIEIIEQFKAFIDWSIFCRKANLNGQSTLIKSFINYIDITSIKENTTIDSDILSFIEEYLDTNIYSKFVYNLKKHKTAWSGNVYHFTHLTNALKIISNKKIISRNKALDESDKFSDSAGSVVHRRNDAHKYARFYFRPQTPTQFYNECLGKDFSSDQYDSALNLGLPKCPIPIFFKFDIDEILRVMPNKCLISNGNLQTNWAKIGTINEMFHLFDFNDLYSTIDTTSDGDWKTYIHKSQQEFLIEDEFDFSQLNNYEILVRTQSDLIQLKYLLKNTPDIISKLRVANIDDNIFINQNKIADYQIEEKSVYISTNYQGDGIRKGYFEIELNNSNFRIKEGQVLSQVGNKLRFYPYINLEFDSEPCFKVIFKDKVSDKSPWQIIKHCKEVVIKDKIYPQTIKELCDIFPEYKDLYETKVRHYFLKDHTNIVLKQFDYYFSEIIEEKERDFFRFFLILHDIGKPIAFLKGDKSKQYKYSVQIIKDVWEKMRFSPKDLDKALFFLEGDIIGEYFQGKKDIEFVVDKITKGSRELEILPQQLFKLFMVYYQCDIASYTQDAGGLRFLEYLFVYENGEKTFNKKEELLQLSSKYQRMYEILKDRIIKWQ